MNLFLPLILKIAPLYLIVLLGFIKLKAHPEKASMAVLISTLIALFYIPLGASLFQF